MKGGIKMKKVFLRNDARGFFFADAETGEFLEKVNVGDLEEEVDWDLVEKQAEENGYELSDKY